MDDNNSQGKEKRGLDRQQLYYYLKVYDDQTNTLAGYLGDISNQGLMLFSRDSIEQGRLFNFRINLEQDLGLGENLFLDAQSVWCGKDINPDYYMIGFKFIDLDPDGLDIVRYLMNKYGFEK